ncbi:MAG: ParB/RepB/Spo0J family partition protein [Syntrophales bacterium]|nr:ParB/RepB/Spo0J family partition protein [Syntrophales bacterium]
MAAKVTLGKGLGALFPDLAEGMGDRPSFIMCGIEELVPNRYQPRKDFSEAEQKQLVASIKKSGIIQPIIVRRIDNSYEIIAGERRWRAAQEAGLKEVPVIIRGAEDQEVAELSLVENIQRESLNPIEEADAYQTLNQRFGLSQDDIALKVGKDRSTVANTLRLLKLPDQAKKALIDKTISSGHARALLSLETLTEQLQALKAVIGKNLSVRETERLAGQIKKIKEKPRTEKRDSFLSEVERQLMDHLMAAVKIQKKQKSGTIEIRFSSEEELNRLINLILSATD